VKEAVEAASVVVVANRHAARVERRRVCLLLIRIIHEHRTEV
jgi:hypothetical protein